MKVWGLDSARMTHRLMTSAVMAANSAPEKVSTSCTVLAASASHAEGPAAHELAPCANVHGFNHLEFDHEPLRTIQV